MAMAMAMADEGEGRRTKWRGQNGEKRLCASSELGRALMGWDSLGRCGACHRAAFAGRGLWSAGSLHTRPGPLSSAILSQQRLDAG